ncbi:MTOR-associated protein MEAK7 isoform X2 [Heptranchias perlo]|uniref:MTOR-associated protein MEAK7 isoform X2 n=1 Tax=Heptranchias perlo TaxID=212740 RepID=UPI0035595530
MGNAESHSSQGCCRFHYSPEELAILDSVFDAMSGSSTSEGTKSGKTAKKLVTLATLKAYVHKAVLGTMTVRLYNGMRSIDPIKKSTGLTDTITKKQFVAFITYVLRGTAEERSLIVERMISHDADGSVKGKQIKEFTEDLIKSVVNLLRHEKMLRDWTLEKTGDSTLGLMRLTAYLMSELKAEDAQLSEDNLLNVEYGKHALEDWVYRVSYIPSFLHLLVTMGFHITKLQPQGELFSIKHMLPQCIGIKYTGLVTVMDIPSVIFLHTNLPSELQSQWKLIFSSQTHGESFSRFSGQILHKGPSILVIKDSDGYIFGGFASHSWDVKPQFQGYNDHYMYLNHGQQTMPNGLGMGGQHNYFGLWIDGDYGGGHSKAKPRCTTYNSPQLSAQENFSIDTLEVWTVGIPPEDPLSKSKGVLDQDPEARTLLEMIGKTRISDGLRDPGEDEEEEGNAS